MSKMTQRRMARRASRKTNQLRRENRTLEKRIGWLSSNLESAFKAIAAQRDRLRDLNGPTTVGA
jgi:hypothetical protein